MYTNNCNYCNKTWQSSHPGKFCRSSCNHSFKKKKLKQLVNFEMHCIECHSSFIAKKIKVKFCSVKCNNSYWFKNNRQKHNLKEANRRAKKLNATPKWLSKEDKIKIKEIYMTCPDGWHVDHIIPLQGKDVSGLHVPWNLQHLPAKENIIKGNKVTI